MNLVDNIKEKMINELSILTEDNIAEVKENFDKYFILLETSQQLFSLKTSDELPSKKEKKPVISKKKDIEVEEKPVLPEKKEEKADNIQEPFYTINDPDTFIFRRRLVGGFAGEDIFVPESIIRNLEIEDGDLLRIKKSGYGKNNRPRYHYEIAERPDFKTESGRLEFNFGLIEYDSILKSYFVQKDVSGVYLKIEDLPPMKALISNQDVANYNLKEGSIVDIAWYENYFENVRVSWLHNVYSASAYQEQEEKAKAKKKETNKTSSSDKKSSEEKEQTLKDKTICMIGLEESSSELENAIASYGGVLQVVSPQLNLRSMSSIIKKSDLVIIMINYTNHKAALHAKKKAKDYDIPFKPFYGRGKELFIKTVHEELVK